MFVYDADRNEVPLLAPGMEVTIEATGRGFRGTLQPIDGWEDADEPVVDRTTDGYSIFYVEVPGQSRQGRCILHERANDWVRV